MVCPALNEAVPKDGVQEMRDFLADLDDTAEGGIATWSHFQVVVAIHRRKNLKPR